VENRIRAIRRFLPKKTALREVYVKRIKEVERSLNYRPIRKFNYNNPIEVLNNNCVELSTNKNIIIHSNTLDLLAAMKQHSMFYNHSILIAKTYLYAATLSSEITPFQFSPNAKS
jgi:signal recognition particle subunit SEC65